MNIGEFKVSFLKQAAVELADNEKASVWEPSRAGSLHIGEAAIRLNGKWRVSAIGNLLGGGLLGELLIKPFFLKDRSETIPFENIERLAIQTKKNWRGQPKTTFHIFQAREQGMVEVHVFSADKEATPGLMNAIKSSVPSHLVQEEILG